MPTSDTKLIFSLDAAAEISHIIAETAPAGIFILADEHTYPLIAQPLAESAPTLQNAKTITIPPGDENKSLETLASIWTKLSSEGAKRHSLLINVGGGMVTDIGGFAASTFKRGIRFVNVPTSLLGAVDAALGGKTGINFAGLKNEIGVFNHAEAVIVCANFFETLPYSELLSGYAELLKHALIESPESLNRALAFDLENPDWQHLQLLLRESILVKQRIVKEDPYEHGLRKALNLGHTVAHALESIAMERGHAMPHGHAVAIGLVNDLVLSNIKFGFSSDIISQVAQFIKMYYPAPKISCSEYPELIALMRHDKKNRSESEINFTLLRRPGEVEINSPATPDEITEALDITRDQLAV